MIEKGKYKARAAAYADFGTSDKGSDFVRVTFTLSEGQAHAGEQIGWSGFFTDKTQERTIQSLRYCGCTFPGGDITNIEGIDRNEVQLLIEHEDYEDRNGEMKTGARVAWVNSLVGGIKEEQRMSETQRRSFAARMKGLVVASAGASKGATPNRPPAPRSGPAPTAPSGRRSPDPEYPPPANVDDIPF